MKLKKSQHGLSLLMKMVVIAIIGILAQVGLSSYQENATQDKTTKNNSE